MLQLTVAGALAALFAGSTIHKCLALAEWPGVIRNYRLVPGALVPIAAGVLLCAGALTAAALLWHPAREFGACAAAVQLTLFGAALWVNIRRGRTHIDCGCFSSRLRQPISSWMVVRNALLALAALTLLLPAGSRGLSVIDIAIAFGSILTLVFLYPVVAVVLEPPPPTYDENYRESAARGVG